MMKKLNKKHIDGQIADVCVGLSKGFIMRLSKHLIVFLMVFSGSDKVCSSQGT